MDVDKAKKLLKEFPHVCKQVECDKKAVENLSKHIENLQEEDKKAHILTIEKIRMRIYDNQLILIAIESGLYMILDEENRGLLLDKYLNKMKNKELCTKYNISQAEIYRRIEKAIGEFDLYNL